MELVLVGDHVAAGVGSPAQPSDGSERESPQEFTGFALIDRVCSDEGCYSGNTFTLLSGLAFEKRWQRKQLERAKSLQCK